MMSTRKACLNTFIKLTAASSIASRKTGVTMLVRLLSTAAFALVITAQGYAEEETGRADERARFQEIYHLLNTDSSRKTFDKAYRLLDEFKKAYPDSPYTLVALGELKFNEYVMYYKAGALEEASALGQKAIEVDDKIAEAYVLMTDIAVERRDAQQAHRMATTAYRLSPSNPSPSTLHAMGRAAILNGDYIRAVHLFEKAAEGLTNPIRKSNMYAWIFHAKSDTNRLPKHRRMDIAPREAAIKKSIELDPHDSLKNSYYGCFLIREKGDLEKGMKHLKIALSADQVWGQPMQCAIYAPYLNWANQELSGNATSTAKDIAAATGTSVEDIFVESALWDGLAPIVTAMMRTKAVTNVNTIGNGTSRGLPNCCPAIANAAFSDNLPLLRQLVEAGANVNAKADSGRTPLFYAIYSENVEMVEYLLEQGARPNVRAKDGATPLFTAVYGTTWARTQLVRTLLKYGANPAAPTSSGIPLVLAVASSTGQDNKLTGADLIKAFVEVGNVDVDMRDSHGNSLLSVAVFEPKQVSYLLESGANPWVKVRGKDVLEFYAPFTNVQTRDYRTNQLQKSMELIRNARATDSSR